MKLSIIFCSLWRIAGGDILQFGEVSSETVDEDDASELQKIKRQLMPGYFIKERRDLDA